jgi:hypothetical protein
MLLNKAKLRSTRLEGYIENFTIQELVHPLKERPVTVRFVSSLGHNQEEMHYRLLKSIISSGPDIDIIIAPEFYYFMIDNREAELYLADLCIASEGKDVLISPGTFLFENAEDFLKSGIDSVPNIAYAIYHGKIIHQVEKFKGPYIPFQLWRWNIGIEICKDLSGLSSAGVNNLNLLLHPSAGIEMFDYHALSQRGYVISCDAKTGNFVFLKSEEGLKRIR